MADWYGTSRSNYFAVKDEAVFREWAKSRELGCLERSGETNLFAIYADGDKGSWPSCDPETGKEIDFVSELSQYLAEGEIAVLVSSGAEKLRYITGKAIAVNDKREIFSLDLRSIYQMAAKHFRVPVSQITRAEY